MNACISWLDHQTGAVISTSRRWAEVIDRQKEVVLCQVPNSAPDLVVGDIVSFSQKEGVFEFLSLQERKNLFARSYGKKTKRLASNLDLLCIVTDCQNLFSSQFIDRVSSVAHQQRIPCCIIVNKSDLQASAETTKLIEIYKQAGFQLIYTNTKTADGVAALKDLLSRHHNMRFIAFTGLSGVGKSSLLNCLIPEANRKVGTLSERTQQGRQTTSQAKAFFEQEASFFIIDLPGVQNFGISALSEEDLKNSFFEFNEFVELCEYIDCNHLAEPTCGVKRAVAEGDLSEQRYHSYKLMYDEILKSSSYD